ncbi:MAG: nitrite reductase small subunit NirD [Actinomycetota bacterium]
MIDDLTDTDLAAMATAVAPVDRLPLDRGVAALVEGEPVAVFRLSDGAIYAIDHVEPFTGVPVLARGLVGSVGDVPTVASPLHKQRFDLRTGVCLDDPDHPVRTWPVEVADDVVHVVHDPHLHSSANPEGPPC